MDYRIIERTEMRMLRWIAGIYLMERIINSKLNIFLNAALLARLLCKMSDIRHIPAVN